MAVTLLGVALLAVSCSASEPKFSITEYLELTDGDAIYPNAEQIAMLESVIPDESYIPFSTIEDREYWDTIAASAQGQEYIAKATELLEREPEVPISDEIYVRANLEGNRGIYKPRYYRTMDRLEHFLLAECMVNDGTFIPQIETYSRAIMEMKSWLHPNHDDRENGVLYGKRVSIDLGARKFGFVLSLVDVTLGDKLSAEVSSQIREQLQWRITNSYLASCKGEDSVGNTWIRATSNWNSVCTSGSVLSIITSSQDKAERVAAIGSAINSMKHYLSGFGADGYCSEGIGYWNYGFGHYLYLAEILYDYTDGEIDLYAFDNPEKLKNVANFPANFQIHDGFYAPFADSGTSVPYGTDNFAYLMSAKHYGANKPIYYTPDESVFTIIGWRDAPQAVDAKDESEYLSSLNNSSSYTYFDDQGIVISRGTQSDKFSVSIKAGHNAENHNHSDVGSYFILLGSDIVAGDIGAPSYVAGAFHPENPSRSSWGHPVPRINNTLQSNGRKFEGKVTSTQFNEDVDMATIDIKSAYELPMIQTLERTMVNDKSGAGEITISDSFSASEPVTFGTAVTVNVDYQIEDGNIILNTGNHKVKVEITAEGGDIQIKDERIMVEKLRSGRKSYRIGIDFTEPLTNGAITVKYTPII